MAALSAELNKLIPSSGATSPTVGVDPSVSRLFATASVNMWLRAVHSFLISASLTGVSDIWASVAGYYSSHYSVRALAHLLGYFQLHARRKVVKLHFENGKHLCEYISKTRASREHIAYWKLVKQASLFTSDQLFTENVPGGRVPQM